jgi:hypothetical protein
MPNVDGSYTVVILGISQNIDIALSIATDNDPVVSASLEAYAVPGAIVIANSRLAAATLYVCSSDDALVLLTTVPPDIYIVLGGSTFHRKNNCYAIDLKT